jgi:hypothetical protein
MAQKIVTSEFKTHLINQLIESINEVANTTYYGFIGNHIQYAEGETSADITIPTNSNKDILTDAFRNMICGKKITSNDMKVMVPRHNWTSGTAYDIYDDQDGDLFTKEFYVAVDETSYFHVYKCLYNANGVNSTAQPTFADVTADSALFANGDDYYETSDGYQWKYMYSVDSTTWNKFATTDYMPVVANSDVAAQAITGSIDVIKVTDHGLGYNNYFNGKFRSTDIKINGNNVLYQLSPLSNTGSDDFMPIANDQTGFYSNCIIHLVDGTGSGQYKMITNSYSTATGVVAVVNSGFTVVPDATTKYKISPAVTIQSDGTQTTNVVARAIINTTSSNSVHRIEIIDPGAGYSYATANVSKGTDATSVTDATIRPIIPPQGGHGADSEKELGGSTLCIYTIFANNESGKISTDNDFRQFGIIRDPKFSNVEIRMVKASDANVVGYDGAFSLNETLYQFKKVKLDGNVTVESGNTIIAGPNTAVYDEWLSGESYVYINSNNDHYFGSVNTVPNSDHIVVVGAPNWSNTTADLYIARVNATGKVDDIETTYIYADSVEPGMTIGQLIIGGSSYAVANISGINIHDKYSNNMTFDTFEQLVKFTGSVTAGTFTEDEVCSQTSGGVTIATGRVHSSNSTTLYITNINGLFLTNTAIVGASSNASFTISNKYNGDLDSTTGSVIYLQNDLAVNRSNTQSEEIRVILEF